MNLGWFLTASARRHPEELAIVHGDRVWTYQQFDREVDVLAAALVDRLHVSPGDRVAYQMWNGPELLRVMFAAFRVGAVVVPLNARLAPAETCYHLTNSDAAAVFVGPEFVAHAEAIAGDRPSTPLVTVGWESVTLGIGVDRLTHGCDAAVEPADVAADDPCWLFYTSGTTGRPKGAVLTAGNVAACTVGWLADLMPLGPSDVTLHAAPLTHGAGFHAVAAVARAVTQVIPAQPRPTSEQLIRLLLDHQVTNTWMVPTQITRLIDSPEMPPAGFPALRWLLHGGAPFPAPQLQVAVERLGPVLVHLYAQGESPMMGTFLPAAHHVADDRVDPRHLQSCGWVRTGMELRIVDEDGQRLPPGEVGEVVLRGPAVMQGYWRDPDATARTLRHGWLHTGDLGSVDQEGLLFLAGRSKDLIISGGANVYAKEVEEALLAHPDLTDAAVIGLPDDDWGERVVAVVCPRGDVDAEGLQAFLRGRIAAYKVPKQVVVADELPRNAYGKVLKHQLRDKLMSAPA